MPSDRKTSAGCVMAAGVIDLCDSHDDNKQLSPVQNRLKTQSGKVKTERVDDGSVARLPSIPILDDEDDDEIEVIEHVQPAFTSTAATRTTGEDDDVKIVGFIGHKHMRCRCPDNPFQTVHLNLVRDRYVFAASRQGLLTALEQNKKACDLCYCYVCYKPYNECQSWVPPAAPPSTHNAHCMAMDKWKKKRQQLRNPTLPASSSSCGISSNLTESFADTFLRETDEKESKNRAWKATDGESNLDKAEYSSDFYDDDAVDDSSDKGPALCDSDDDNKQLSPVRDKVKTERVDDGSDTLTNQGSHHYHKGELKLALQCFRTALEIEERETSNSLTVATLCNNIGIVLQAQCDLERALKEYRKALEIEEREVPNSLTVATSYNNIGTVLNDQSELEGALKEYRKALEIEERDAPNSLAVATSYNNIGTVLQAQDDLEGALKEYRKALEIQERDAPNSLAVAASYNNIGTVLKDQGDLEGALKEYRKALEIQEREAPNSWAVGRLYNNIGFCFPRGDS
jgi:tetratricopeptide (TPR) repeat protein